MKVRKGWYEMEYLPQIPMLGKEPAVWMGTGNAVPGSAWVGELVAARMSGTVEVCIAGEQVSEDEKLGVAAMGVASSPFQPMHLE